MVAKKVINFNQGTDAVPLRKVKPKKKQTRKNPYRSVVLKGHNKKEIWSPSFQPVVVLKPLFPDHLVKLIMEEQKIKSAKKKKQVCLKLDKLEVVNLADEVYKWKEEKP